MFKNMNVKEKNYENVFSPFPLLINEVRVVRDRTRKRRHNSQRDILCSLSA